MNRMHVSFEELFERQGLWKKLVNFYTDKIFSIKSLKKLSEIYGRKCSSRYRRHKKHKIGVVYILVKTLNIKKKLNGTERHKENSCKGRPIRMMVDISMKILKAERACLKRCIIGSERLKLLIQANILQNCLS